MPWQNETVRILRYLINDLDNSSYTYTDSRLEETILVGAQLASMEVDFETTYTIDVDACMLSPDPTDSSTRDNGFINLVCLKAAILVLSGELKTYALNSVRVSDGPSTIDFTDVVANKQLALKNAQEMYEQAKINYQAGGRVGQAILGPYTNVNLNPYYLYNFN